MTIRIVIFLLTLVSSAAGQAVAKENGYKLMPGTETPAFKKSSDGGRCVVFREYIVKTSQRRDTGENVTVYKREASAIGESACKETGSSYFDTESSDQFFFGLSGSLLFVNKDSSVEPYRDLTIYNLKTREWLTEETYTGEPNLVDGRFVVFDSDSEKIGGDKTCKDYAKWISEDLSITWVQVRKLDLQTLKVSNVGGLRCLSYRLRNPGARL